MSDAAAETVGCGARVGADPHLIERARAPAAKQRTQQTGITIADHCAEPRHSARIHRQRALSIEAGCKLNSPGKICTELHMLLQLNHEWIGRAPEQGYQFAATRRRQAI